MTAATVGYVAGYTYGVGVDTASGDARNMAATGAPAEVPQAGGDVVTYQMFEVDTFSQMTTSLGISASASGGVGLFSASARMDFAKSTNINDSSLYLMVIVKVTKAFQSIPQPGISTAAAGLLSNAQMTQFQDQYGDMFVRGMLTGGLFYGVIQVTTHDQQDKSSLSIALKGSYAAFSASGAFDTNFQQSISSRQTSVYCYTEGGKLGTLPHTIPELMTAAQSFYDTVDNNPVPHSVLLDPYSILPLPAPPNYIDLQHQKDVLTECATARDNDIQALNNVDYILANPAEFINPDIGALTGLRGKLQTDLQAIAAAASHALDVPREAAFPTLTAGAIQLPARIANSPAPPPPPPVFVTIPNWGDIETMDRGGGPTLKSSDELGLKINTQEDDSVPVRNEGDIISMSPPAGTVVPSGSVVTVTFSRNAPADR
jgi:hypothetical protein